MAYYNQTHKGEPSFSIPSAYLKAALHLLILGTKRLREKYDFDVKEYENNITRKLVAEMHAEQEDSEQYIIRVDIFPGTLSDPTSSSQLSEIDIRFTWDNYHPNSYLAAEAKRLFGKGASLAGPYVEKGVMNSIGGKYSRGHNRGIMLGYILSKPIDNALSSVKKALEDRRTKTNEIIPIDKVQGCFGYSLMHKSTHTQKVTGEKIILYHMFVDLAS
ncbi:hypothetical protein C5S39_02215 [Candidatus Methanophagaceae archaeon]|jgi:hypothetical protein|nr:hypothetical protein C5S39_02215 [Methanophagales archaeon]